MYSSVCFERESKDGTAGEQRQHEASHEDTTHTPPPWCKQPLASDRARDEKEEIKRAQPQAAPCNAISLPVSIAEILGYTSQRSHIGVLHTSLLQWCYNRNLTVPM